MEIAVILALILLNGFFALSEIALISSKRSRLEELAAQGSGRAKKVLRLMDNPETFLSSVQVGITLIGIVSGAFAGIALAADFRFLFNYFEVTKQYSQELAMVTVVSLITYLSIVIGELLPKTIALNNPEKISMVVAPVIRLFTLLTYPFVKLLSVSTQLLQKAFFIKTGRGEVLTEEDLRGMLKLARKQGVLDQAEVDIHHNVFSFVDKKANQVMTRRSDIEYIWLNESLEEVRKKLEESSHSIFPVCGETIDNVVGIITGRDFFENHLKEGFTLESIMLQPLYISETMPTTRILTQFRAHKLHFGCVFTEYGAFEGIVTLHDLTECILGELPGMDETNEPDIIVRDDGSLLVNGQTPIEELCNALNTRIFIEKEHQYKTVAGLVIEHIGRIPHEAEKVVIDDYSFEIADMDDNRIDKLIVAKIDRQQDMKTEG